MKSTLRLSKYIHLRSTLNQVFCQFCHTSLTIGLWFSACSETGKAAVKVLLFEMCHMRLKKMPIFNVFRISSDHWNYQCIQRYHKLKRNLAQYCVFTRCDLWPYWKMLTCKKTWMFAYFTIQVKQKCSCKCQIKSLGSNTKEGEFPFRVGQFWINKKNLDYWPHISRRPKPEKEESRKLIRYYGKKNMYHDLMKFLGLATWLETEENNIFMGQSQNVLQ